MKELIKPIAEFIIRLFSKSPKFFKGIQWLVGIITALLAFLTYAESQDMFQAPAWVEQYLGASSVLMGILTYILAKLPAENPAQVKSKVNRMVGEQ